MKRAFLVTLFLATLAFTTTASADAIDQSFLTPSDIYVGAACGGCQSLAAAQTFTAGMSGRMTGFSFIGWSAHGGGNYHFSVNTVDGTGLPTYNELWSTDMNLPSDTYFGGGDVIPVSGLTLAQGQQYALVITWGGTGYSLYWNGAYGDPYIDLYTGGAAYFQQDGTGFFMLRQNLGGSDLNFQTYVDPVPEPGTMILLGSGLLGAWLKRRRN